MSDLDLDLAQAADSAIKAAGGASAVARKISESEQRDPPLTPQAVGKWAKTKVPAERVLQLEQLQDEVDRFDLRPDIYPKQKTPSVS